MRIYCVQMFTGEMEYVTSVTCPLFARTVSALQCACPGSCFHFSSVGEVTGVRIPAGRNPLSRGIMMPSLPIKHVIPEDDLLITGWFTHRHELNGWQSFF
jgi:hypothetical protein